jgi:hypothetical protein
MDAEAEDRAQNVGEYGASMCLAKYLRTLESVPMSTVVDLWSHEVFGVIRWVSVGSGGARPRLIITNESDFLSRS